MGSCHRSAGLLAASVVLLVGCGSDSSSPDKTAVFKKSFTPVVNEFRSTSRAIGKNIQRASTQTDAQLVTAFRGLANRWQAPLSRLQTLTPPSNLATTFNTLNRAATRVETDLNAIVAAAETHSADAAKQASASLVNDILAAKTASTKITNKLKTK
jgi:hypothetical protein